jgi:hypothetical protein
MTSEPKAFASLHAGCTEDGRGIGVRFVAQDGSSIDLGLDKDMLSKLITDLTEIAVTAAKVRTKGVPLDPRIGAETLSLNQAINATHIAVAMASDRSLHLILRLFDFDLSYQVDAKDLRSTAESLLQAVKALEAEHGRPN